MHNKSGRIVSLFILLLILCCEFSYSQTVPTGQGRKFILLGGGVAYSDGYMVQEPAKSAHFEGRISYFTLTNLSLGVDADLITFSNNERLRYDMGLGPSILLFVAPNEEERAAGAHVYPYIGLALLVRRYDIESHSDIVTYIGSRDVRQDRWGGAWKATLGIVVDVGPTLSLTPSISYRLKDAGENSEFDIIFSIGILKFSK